MQENFTTNDLIKYIYKETSLTETLEIGAALEEDFDLLQQLLFPQLSLLFFVILF